MNLQKTRILLIREPIDGRLGIRRLSTWVKSWFNPGPDDEITVVFRNRNSLRLRVIHIDPTGESMLIRQLYDHGKFKWLFEDRHPITVEELRRLIIDGTVDGGYQFARSRALLERPAPALM